MYLDVPRSFTSNLVESWDFNAAIKSFPLPINNMSQLEHYVVKGKSHLVCKLKKSLYGLKQSPRMWYQKFDTYMLSLGFVRSKSDHYVYFKSDGDGFLVITLYVDDMLFIGKGKG